MTEVSIREETEADFTQITDVIDQAFKGKPYAGGDESAVVLRLREARALSLALVAERMGEFAGHIAFSPVTADDGSADWYALGPVAVYPKFQSKGIGAQLIEAGLAKIKNRGAAGCMLTGNPEYYRRFGFEFSERHCPVNETPEFFMIKRLSDVALPSSRLSFHRAFYGPVA